MPVGVHKSPRGLPKFVPTEEDRSKVKMLAAHITPQSDIAVTIINPRTHQPISPDTLRAAFPDELKHGKTQSKVFAIGKLYKLMQKDNPAAIMFYLKTQCGWRETERHQWEGPPIPVAVSGTVRVSPADAYRAMKDGGDGPNIKLRKGRKA